MKTHRYILFIIACVLSIGTGWAKQQTFYYKYTAKTSTGDTKYGSVYASTDKNATPSYKATVASDQISVDAYTAPSVTVYLWAKPVTGYTVEKWSGSDGSTLYGTETSGEFTASSTTSGSPTSVTYTAYFKKLGVLRVFADNGGAAYVSKIDNDNGETVTLEAYNLYDYKFTGWMHNGSIFSTEKTLQVTVPNLATGEHDDWTATFAEQEIQYYRLRSDKGYYLSIVGNQGGQLTHTSSGNNYLDGFKLNGTIKLISTNVQNDPSTILKVTHGTQTSGVYSDFDIEAQGIKLTDVIKNALSGSDVSFSEKFTLISDGKGGYKIKNAEQGFFLQGVGNDGNGYLVGEEYSNAKNDIWYFEPVDGSTNTANLAVTSEKTIGDKHYATLFVPFPFQCADGMKAYYVANIVDDRAECNTNGIVNVHGFTPVILEWTDGSNYVVPINTETDQPGNVVSTAIDNDWWKGCINLYTTGGANPTQRTCYFDRNGNMTDAGKTLTFDNSIMRVMDVDGDNLVLNKNFTQGNAMPSNKCYVEKDPVKDLYVVIFPLELDEASPELSEPHNAIYAEVHVLRSVAGPKDGEEWGNWNTLCLPFDLDATEIESLFGECELKALDHFWVTDDGTLHLRFEDATAIACGQPYLIRVKKDIADITLHNKWVNTEKLNNQHLATDDYTLDFQGSYVYLNGTNGQYVPQKSYIINKNLYYYVDSNVKMKGFRAYFKPEAAPTAKTPIKAMKTAEGEPTAISNICIEGLEDGAIYNTQGIRLNSMQRGINIVNGKKIIR